MRMIVSKIISWFTLDLNDDLFQILHVSWPSYTTTLNWMVFKPWPLNKVLYYLFSGTKTQPLEDILSVSWNKQVQHILASTFSSKCVIWDLRKNEPIIKLTDTVSRIRWKVVAWHPEVATQLCLASGKWHIALQMCRIKELVL